MALFGSSLSSRYRRILSRAFSIAADELDIDLVLFNAYGKLRSINSVEPDNESGLIDYVDLDPFGSPAPFVQSAILGCRKKGILAITATDTAPLAGAHAPKCRRRYQSEPVRGYMCHEGGLRILMCSIARELAKFDRGMKPLLSFYADHYFRTYIQIEEGAEKADKMMAQLGYMKYDMATLERSTSVHYDPEHKY